MRFLLLIALSICGCVAQTGKLNVPTFTGTQPCVLVYVPVIGTTTLLPQCATLGNGLQVAAGVISAVVPAPAATLVSHVESFPLSGFGPFPTDGSDKTISITLSKQPVGGSAVFAYTNVPGFQVLTLAIAPPSVGPVTFILGQEVYAAPVGISITVSYLAAS